jgi:predicted nucleotidyltransferase
VRVDSSPALASLDHQVRDRVTPFIEDLRRRRLHNQVVAVVVVGSAARGEQWPRSAAQSSDIDVMVITRSGSIELGRRIKHVIDRYQHDGLEGGQVPMGTLSRHRTLLNYEARWSGCVIEGDRTVLDRIPMMGPRDIPRWEAVRLLFNRLMEHLMLRTGATNPERVVQKTYEALGEASLVMQRRYQPTFRGRLQELHERPVAGDADVNAKVLQALERRFRPDVPVPDGSISALRSLRNGLDATLASYLGEQEPVRSQLEKLGRMHRNVPHRLYWLGREALRGSVTLTTLRQDPSIGVWRMGLDVLDGITTTYDAHTVLRAWRACPQILDAKATM